MTKKCDSKPDAGKANAKTGNPDATKPIAAAKAKKTVAPAVNSSAQRTPAKTVAKKGTTAPAKAIAQPAAKTKAPRQTTPGLSRPTATKSVAQKPVTRQVFISPAWRQRLALYVSLMRLNRPIGILLLLWPTLWALWLAAGGWPRWDLLIIFILGVIVMRSAGCVINDIADRNIDGHVKRTQQRPIATGTVATREAWGLIAGLCLLALILVLFTNSLTVQLSVGGLLLAGCYPFMKRHTHLPQVVLGAAFAWSIPMAFAAQRGSLNLELWLVYVAVVLWTVVYDTFYAMVDRDDDRRIGVKSTAILFGEQDRFITGFLQALTIYALILVGQRFELGMAYEISLVIAAALFGYQQYLIRFREREACFKAFLNNHWVGMAVFIGIAVDLALVTPK
jgi:4-hydroxybenzoate polyprenyltransferase